MMPASAAAVRFRPSNISTVKPTMPSSAMSTRSRHCAGHHLPELRARLSARPQRQRHARHGEAEQHENVDRKLGHDRLAERHVGARQRHGGKQRQGGGEAGHGWHRLLSCLCPNSLASTLAGCRGLPSRLVAGIVSVDLGCLPRGGNRARGAAMAERSTDGHGTRHPAAGGLVSTPSSGMRRAACRASPRCWRGCPARSSSCRPCSTSRSECAPQRERVASEPARGVPR